MSINFFDNKIFDTGFITRNEGGSFTFPYHPAIPAKGTYKVSRYKTRAEYVSHYADFNVNAYAIGPKSGITICTGFDLASKPSSLFNSMNNQTQANLLKSAIGLTLESAYTWLWDNQALFGYISDSDTKILMNWVYNANYLVIKKDFPKFDTYDIKLRTAIFDIAHNGTGSKYYQGAISYISNGDISGLISYVSSRQYIESSRRNRLASLLKPLISNQAVASTGISTQDQLKKPTKKQSTSSGNKVDAYCSLMFGNEFNLSEYVSSDSSRNFFKNILSNIKVDDKDKISTTNIDVILGAIGLENNDAVKYIEKNASNFNLSSIQTDAILDQFIVECRSKIKEVFNKDFNELPREVNTALVSYLLDSNILDKDVYVNEISPLIPLVNSGKYNELANKLEVLDSELQDRYISRRKAEANLIRKRTSDNPNYSSNSIDNTDQFFASEENKLDSEYAITQANYRALKKQWEADYSNDEIHSQVTKDVADSYADILEKHQISIDNFYNDEKSDYEIRLTIKEIFNTLTRSKSKSYYQVEKDLANDGNQILLSQEYQYFPYATGMFYQTKLNAVNRCKYRIKKLESKIRDVESDLSSYGVPVDITNSELAILTITMPVVAVAIIIINTLLAEHKTYASKLDDEKSNLINLLKELNRFTKTNNS